MTKLVGSSSTTGAVESEIKHYFGILWRWLWLVVLCVMISSTVSYLLSSYVTPVYRASTTLMIDTAPTPEGVSDVRDLLFIERLSQTWAQLMERKSTMSKVAEQINIDESVLLSDIESRQVVPIRDTQLMRIDVESISPTLAALVANTMPEVFIDELGAVQADRFAELKGPLEAELADVELEVQQKQSAASEFPTVRTTQEDVEYNAKLTELSELQSERRNLRARLDSIRLAEAQGTDRIAVVEAAEVPLAPIRPRILVNTLLAAIIGGLIALGFIFAIEFLDDRTRSPSDLRKVIDIPLLGAIAVIPNVTKDRSKPTGIPDQSLIALREPRNPLTEAYRGVRTNLQFASIDTGLRALMITSAMPGEGKSTTAANLAIVMAQAGYSVAIVDADMRKPRLHSIFGIPARPGVVDAILSDEVSPLKYSPDRLVQNLKILPVGKRPPNPSELLGSLRMKKMIARIQEEVDFVIFDAPPVLAVTDAQILSGLVDQVLLVVGNGTDKAAVVQAVESLQMVNAPLIGYVFNGLDRSAQGGGYYYYQDYYGEDENPNLSTGPTLEIPVYKNGNSPKETTSPLHKPAVRK